MNDELKIKQIEDALSPIDKELIKPLRSQFRLFDALANIFPTTSTEARQELTSEIIDQISENLEKGNQLAFLEKLNEKDYKLSIFDMKIKKQD